MSAFPGKRGVSKPLNIRDLLKIGVFLGQKISEKGVFFNLENTDGLQLDRGSGGTGLLGTSRNILQCADHKQKWPFTRNVCQGLEINDHSCNV